MRNYHHSYSLIFNSYKVDLYLQLLGCQFDILCAYSRYIDLYVTLESACYILLPLQQLAVSVLLRRAPPRAPRPLTRLSRSQGIRRW